jgi:hypothetical protein
MKTINLKCTSKREFSSGRGLTSTVEFQVQHQDPPKVEEGEPIPASNVLLGTSFSLYSTDKSETDPYQIDKIYSLTISDVVSEEGAKDVVE